MNTFSELNINKKLFTQIKQEFIDLGIKEKNIETSKLNIRMNLLNRNKQFESDEYKRLQTEKLVNCCLCRI